MGKGNNFYEILGVSEDASQEDIQRAYRRLAVRFHPDKNPDDKAAEEKFKDLGQAYAVLSDPGKRAQYDQQLHMGFPPEGVPGGFPGGAGYGDWEAISTEEILRRFGDLFGDAFGGGFGGGFGQVQRGARMRQRGQDIEASITVPFRPATIGDRVDVTLHDSSGQRTLSISIPPGTRDGATLRLKGQGGQGLYGGPSGDLFLRVHVTPDPVFRRRGNDIEADLPVPAPVAVLGGKVGVRTLKGAEGTVTVPPGTSTGKLLRLRGQGVQGGDYLARVVVTVPKEPNDEERELYGKLRDMEGG